MEVSVFQATATDVVAHYERNTKQPSNESKPPRKTRSTKPKLDLPRSLKGEPFIKGPIPFDWMRLATRCGGRGAEVGVLLWYAAGWQKSNPVRFTASIRQQFGIHQKTSKRVLVRMQEAGLVDVEFHRGRSPVVTLLRPEVAIDDD